MRRDIGRRILLRLTTNMVRSIAHHYGMNASLRAPSAGTSTGISAHDRALTVRSLASPSATSADFTRPGHMVPLRSRDGGTLTRKGHTESATDLCILSDLPAAGVLCELVNDDETGSMARRDDCRLFADRWGLKMISVEMLAEWRRRETQEKQ